MKNDREEISRKWYNNLRLTGYGYRDINKAYEDAGAVGLISSIGQEFQDLIKYLMPELKRFPILMLILKIMAPYID